MCRDRFKLLLLLCIYLSLRITVSATNSTESVKEETSRNYTNLTNNTMWNSLLENCKKPSMSCIQKFIYNYLDDTLETKNNVSIEDVVVFVKNDYNYTIEDVQENNEEKQIGRSSPLGGVITSLHGKALKFFMTHDMQFQLPEFIFEGAMLRISPRSIEENGAFFKIEIQPKAIENVGEGRILFKKISKYTSIIMFLLLWRLPIFQLHKNCELNSLNNSSIYLMQNLNSTVIFVS